MYWTRIKKSRFDIYLTRAPRENLSACIYITRPWNFADYRPLCAFGVRQEISKERVSDVIEIYWQKFPNETTSRRQSRNPTRDERISICSSTVLPVAPFESQRFQLSDVPYRRCTSVTSETQRRSGLSSTCSERQVSVRNT